MGKDSHASLADTAEAEQRVTTVEVELPTVGRVVHVRVDPGSVEPTLRPAVVLSADDVAAGVLRLKVFLDPDDVPVAYGTGIRQFGNSFYVSAPYGPECGEWRWPERVEEPETFTATI